MDINHTITIYIAGCTDRMYKFGGWAVIVKNITLDEVYELSGNDIDTTDRRMTLIAISEALKSVFQKYGSNNFIDLISPSKYLRRAIGNWKECRPTGRPGWIYSWAKHDWKKHNNHKVHNALMWEEIYNWICKQHTIRYTRSELIRNSVYVDRCHYLAMCARTNNIPTPFNYNVHPNIFKLIDRDSSFDFRDLVKTKSGWKTLIYGIRKLAASVDIDVLSSQDLIELEHTIELLKLRLDTNNARRNVHES